MESAYATAFPTPCDYCGFAGRLQMLCEQWASCLLGEPVQLYLLLQRGVQRAVRSRLFVELGGDVGDGLEPRRVADCAEPDQHGPEHGHVRQMVELPVQRRLLRHLGQLCFALIESSCSISLVVFADVLRVQHPVESCGLHQLADVHELVLFSRVESSDQRPVLRRCALRCALVANSRVVTRCCSC